MYIGLDPLVNRGGKPSSKPKEPDQYMGFLRGLLCPLLKKLAGLIKISQTGPTFYIVQLPDRAGEKLIWKLQKCRQMDRFTEELLCQQIWVPSAKLLLHLGHSLYPGAYTGPPVLCTFAGGFSVELLVTRERYDRSRVAHLQEDFLLQNSLKVRRPPEIRQNSRGITPPHSFFIEAQRLAYKLRLTHHQHKESCMSVLDGSCMSVLGKLQQ